jgi:hypothetical protein
MTQGRRFPPMDPPSQYHDILDDQDDGLSPSDGYFGDNNSVPDALLIPDPSRPQIYPSGSSKAAEAERESHPSGASSPSDVRYASYTPATTHTPTISSRDSESAYSGSTSRYQASQDGLSEHSPLLEEPPPLYDDAVAEGAPGSSRNVSHQLTPPPRGGCESMQVCEPVSSFRAPESGSRCAPKSIAIVVDNRNGKSYDEELHLALPQRPKRRGCCSRRKAQKKGRSRFKRFLSLLLGAILALWLLVHLAKWVKHAHGVLDILPLCTLNFTRERRLIIHSFSQRFHTPNVPPHGPVPTHDAPNLGREFRQHETRRSISGTYSLYDLLDLKTLSGSITITIVPQPGIKPAVLRLSSTSGSIRVKIDKSYLNAAEIATNRDALNRTFDTQISSFSGSIGGSILVGGGGQTTVTAKSGSLDLAIYPVNVDNGSPESTLSTSTASGSSHIKVQNPVFGGKVTQLVANHQSVGSGSMTIKYPSPWEGEIHALSVGSGSVTVRGEGLKFRQHGSREVMGWRGDENNRKVVNVKTLGSGSINFNCR